MNQECGYPFVSCLCPTYRRPKLLENSIACFEAQDYPAGRRELVILDDAEQIAPQGRNGWRVHSVAERFPTLPSKYNALAGLADPRAEIFVIWEDDDVYLPWHVSAHVRALERGSFSKPSRVLSLYTGQLVEESADGRFFASCAIRVEAWRTIGGVPDTSRADFDQQFMARASKQGPIDTLSVDSRPSYVFRWGSTQAYHGQHAMRSPDDVTWYDRVSTGELTTIGVLQPLFDAENALIQRS